MAMIRQGTCNRCGQCCGAPGGPDRRTPFGKSWPDSLRHKSLDDINVMCPQATMLGVTMTAEDIVGVEEPVGSYRVQGTNFYYVWVDGLGVQRDTSAAHDGSSYEPECPFLLDDPGDGTRPCGLFGTNDDGAFIRWCEADPTFPRSEKHTVEWQWRYPGCSYTWVAE